VHPLPPVLLSCVDAGTYAAADAIGSPVPNTAKKLTQQRLKGKVALITGASRGIGLAIAQALASEGCHLVLTGRTIGTLEKTARKLSSGKVRVLAKLCDVRDPHAVRALAHTIQKQFPRLDILINNAGIAHPNLPVAKLPYHMWKSVIDTNLTGTFLVTREMLPLMRRGGTIVNNLSIAATRVFPGSSAYNASKHGALGFSDTLREELREKGIRVIALMPGATDTDIWDTLWPKAPRKKMMSSETIAHALIGALALPENSTMEQLTITPTAGAL
jgi:NAD(P)-dependent dehydrogenase (short-subunit alcohol dehydrogenase family)